MRVKNVVSILKQMDQGLKVYICTADDSYDNLIFEFFNFGFIREENIEKKEDGTCERGAVFFTDRRIDNFFKLQEKRIIDAVTKEFRDDFYAYIKEKTKEYLDNIK